MAQLFRIAVSMLVVTLVAPAAALQAQTGRGSIAGRVTDSSNAVLPGATVTVAPGGAHTVTDASGEYAVLGVAPGEYNHGGLRRFHALSRRR